MASGFAKAGFRLHQGGPRRDESRSSAVTGWAREEGALWAREEMCRKEKGESIYGGTAVKKQAVGERGRGGPAACLRLNMAIQSIMLSCHGVGWRFCRRKIARPLPRCWPADRNRGRVGRHLVAAARKKNSYPAKKLLDTAPDMP